MAKSDKERAQEYRERKVEARRQQKAEGLLEVKVITAGPATEAIEHLGQITVDLYLKKLPEITDRDLNMTSYDTLEAFLRSGTPQMIEYKIDGMGSIGVKMIPFRSVPVIATYLLTGHHSSYEYFHGKFPILNKINEFHSYHWKTLEYIEICDELGLDSLYHAPEFNYDYADIAWSLLDWDVAEFSKNLRKTSPEYYAVRNFIFDVLDFLRIDDFRQNVSPPSIARNFARLGTTLEKYGVPNLEVILELSENPKILNLKNVNSSTFGMIEFLPSTYGPGYKASIYGWAQNHEPDGWIPGCYDDLHGVALLPEEPDSWIRAIIERLRSNGVIFLTAAQAETYMQGEGQYWLWFHGLEREIPAVKKAIWSVCRPRTPISNHASKLAQAAEMLRGNREFRVPQN